jgi:hypothetical protein
VALGGRLVAVSLATTLDRNFDLFPNDPGREQCSSHIVEDKSDGEDNGPGETHVRKLILELHCEVQDLSVHLQAVHQDTDQRAKGVSCGDCPSIDLER